MRPPNFTLKEPSCCRNDTDKNCMEFFNWNTLYITSTYTPPCNHKAVKYDPVNLYLLSIFISIINEAVNHLLLRMSSIVHQVNANAML